MGWFTSSSAANKELPADIWQICPSCQAHVFKDEWAANMKVCPKCNFHDRLGCRERIDLLIMLDVPPPELVRRLVERHESFGRQRADAAHWVRTVDMPNAELVARSGHRCDEIWQPS